MGRDELLGMPTEVSVSVKGERSLSVLSIPGGTGMLFLGSRGGGAWLEDNGIHRRYIYNDFTISRGSPS